MPIPSKQNSTQIRLIEPADALVLRQLRLESLKTDPEAFLSTPEYESQFDEHYFVRRLAFNTKPPLFGYWGCFDKNRLLGYVQLAQDLLPKGNHVAFLYELYVQPDYRQQGLARQLVGYLINQCRNSGEIEQIILYLTANNKPALKLYDCLGFKQKGVISGRVKIALGEYRDQIIMQLAL